jgi:hypothetical protein
MIVRQANAAIHLITQPDHARLSRHIMERWQPLYGAERRASILLAIAEHDNGWREPDEAPSVEPATGRIHDFINVAADVRQAVWPRGIRRLSHDPWAAALVAQHALTVYDRFRPDDAWRGFFADVEAMRDALVSSTRFTHRELEADYAYVRIGDLISLIFCNRWEDEQTYAQCTFRLEGDSVMVLPEAFGGRQIPFAVTAREIADRPYESDAALRAVIRASPIVTLRGSVRG